MLRGCQEEDESIAVKKSLRDRLSKFFEWIEDAIYDMVDCYGVAVTIDNYVYNNCSFCPAVTGIVNSACTNFLNQGVQQVSQAIDQATVELGLIKRKGIVKVDSETKLSGGKWYGSLAGGDFPGEFTATKK